MVWTSTSAIAQNDTPIYNVVEVMPRFPGGEVALVKYIEENINYSPQMLQQDVDGHVIVRFVVDTIGAVTKVEILQSIDSVFDAEAVRVVKSLPRFTPGRHRGRRVAVWYTLPIAFRTPLARSSQTE